MKIFIDKGRSDYIELKEDKVDGCVNLSIRAKQDGDVNLLVTAQLDISALDKIVTQLLKLRAKLNE